MTQVRKLVLRSTTQREVEVRMEATLDRSGGTIEFAMAHELEGVGDAHHLHALQSAQPGSSTAGRREGNH